MMKIPDEKHKKRIPKLAVRISTLALLALVLLSAGAVVYVLRGKKVSISEYSSVSRPAKIRPDYTGIVIPPNIAPLNFTVQEDGSYYYVKIYSSQGKPIELTGKTARIVIPRRPWQKLLKANRGRQLYFDVFVRTKQGRWNRFARIANKIADEDIDGYLLYRKIHPGHNVLRETGIYQRNLQSYRESLVLHNRSLDSGCVNCHTLCSNRTDTMLIHVRCLDGPSMLLIRNGRVSCVNSRTGFGGKPMGHAAWHPSGNVIVFTIYDVRQFYHAARTEVRDALDFDSAMGYYLVDGKEVKTTTELSRKNRLETWPAWSPDGRYLYFCVAPLPPSPGEIALDKYYVGLKYDLVRISYDLARDKWGKLETVISADETGKSALLPQVSPDGRWLLFCMCDHSAWAGFQEDSDLYVVDLEAAQRTGRYQYRRLDINSDQADYWKNFSTNSRWIVFSTKRDDGMFTKAYFSYVDKDGRFHKPFILPQKDPAFYDSYMNIYSLPELATGPVPITGERLARLVRGKHQPVVGLIPVTAATPKAGMLPATDKFLRPE